MTVKLSKNFHGVNVDSLSKIMAVKAKLNSVNINSQNSTYKERRSSICCLPQCHISVPVASSKFVALKAEPDSINLDKNQESYKPNSINLDKVLKVKTDFLSFFKDTRRLKLTIFTFTKTLKG